MNIRDDHGHKCPRCNYPEPPEQRRKGVCRAGDIDETTKRPHPNPAPHREFTAICPACKQRIEMVPGTNDLKIHESYETLVPIRRFKHPHFNRR